MKTRWFNYRPICLIFLFLLLGSLFSFFISKDIALFISIAVIFFVVLLILACVKKKIKYLAIPVLSFVFGISCYNFRLIIFNKTIDYKPTEISCRVCGIKKSTDGLIVVQADHCKLDDNSINDNIILYIYGSNNPFNEIEIGSNLDVVPTNFYTTDLFSQQVPNSKYFSENIKYVVISNINKIQIQGKTNTIDEIVRDRVKDNLSLALTDENREVVYSALFGDRTSMLSEQYNIFKSAGIAHLLAVSGLHVSIIIGVLFGILTLLRVKKKYRLACLLPILIFYAYLCNFSVSVTRAIIMCVIAMVAKLKNRRYDIYNSLAVAGIVIYLINPLCVFDASFLLSFLTVFGIATLYNLFNNAFEKIKMNMILANSLALTMSATISIFAVMIFYFKTINLISFVANILILPLFSVVFSISFVVASFSLIIPYVVYLIQPLNYIFEFINFTSRISGSFSIANIQTTSIGFVAIILYFLLILINGRLNMSKTIFKLMCSIPVFMLLCLTFLII